MQYVAFDLLAHTCVLIPLQFERRKTVGKTNKPTIDCASSLKNTFIYSESVLKYLLQTFNKERIVECGKSGLVLKDQQVFERIW